MCQFASFVLTRDREFWGPTESHEKIIEHHGLHADGAHGPNVLRIEVLPPDDSATLEDLSTWQYHVDQDCLPEWAEADPGKCEERARAALSRRAFEERWFVREAGGDDSTLTGGYGSTLTGGDGSTLTGGYGSTLTGGDGSTLTGGDGSTLTGGYGSTLTGGDGSTLTGGYGSTLTGGDGSTLSIRYWDPKSERDRVAVGYVGEDGIEPDTAYVVTCGRLARKAT